MVYYQTSSQVAVSVVSMGRSLVPSDFKDVFYSPDMVLPVHFDVSILSYREYGLALENGYEAYFQEMYDQNSGDIEVFEDRFYSLYDVQSFLVENAFPDVPPYPVTPLAWRVGFVVGWLSALALTDKATALQGLDFLLMLLPHL